MRVSEVSARQNTHIHVFDFIVYEIYGGLWLKYFKIHIKVKVI